MTKTKKFPAVKTTMYGVFYVGQVLQNVFRTLEAAFSNKKEADEWAKKYSKENYNCDVMVEEINVTIPAWDGTMPKN